AWRAVFPRSRCRGSAAPPAPLCASFQDQHSRGKYHECKRRCNAVCSLLATRMSRLFPGIDRRGNGLDQTLPKTEIEQLDIGIHAELRLDRIVIVRHRLAAQVECRSDLVGRFCADDHAENFELARRKSVQPRFLLLHPVKRESLADLGTNRQPAFRNVSHRPYEKVGEAALGYIPFGAGTISCAFHAAGVNPYDTYMRAGTHALKPPRSGLHRASDNE